MKSNHRYLLSVSTVLLVLALLFGTLAAGATVPKGAAAEVVRLVNVERAKAGLSALSSSHATLNAAARLRAGELPRRIDATHRRPDGREWHTALEESGVGSYHAAGENIAAGQKSAAEVVKDWMNSPGHKANILGDYKYIGVGVVEKNGRLYWSQEFLKPVSIWGYLLHMLQMAGQTLGIWLTAPLRFFLNLF
jgi:uncharacterized protein YkwD